MFHDNLAVRTNPVLPANIRIHIRSTGKVEVLKGIYDIVRCAEKPIQGSIPLSCS